MLIMVHCVVFSLGVGVHSSSPTWSLLHIFTLTLHWYIGNATHKICIECSHLVCFGAVWSPVAGVWHALVSLWSPTLPLEYICIRIEGINIAAIDG